MPACRPYTTSGTSLARRIFSLQPARAAVDEDGRDVHQEDVSSPAARRGRRARGHGAGRWGTHRCRGAAELEPARSTPARFSWTGIAPDDPGREPTHGME